MLHELILQSLYVVRYILALAPGGDVRNDWLSHLSDHNLTKFYAWNLARIIVGLGCN